MKDWRILSHGRKIFTADDRFDLVQDENPDPNKIIGASKSSKQSSSPKSYFSFANPNNNNNNKIRYICWFLKAELFHIFIRYVESCHCIFLQFLISFIFRDFQSVNKYDQPNSKQNSEKENLQDWILIVKHVVARDSGKYECQVWFMYFFFVSKIIYA